MAVNFFRYAVKSAMVTGDPGGGPGVLRGRTGVQPDPMCLLRQGGVSRAKTKWKARRWDRLRRGQKRSFLQRFQFEFRGPANLPASPARRPRILTVNLPLGRLVGLHRVAPSSLESTWSSMRQKAGDAYRTGNIAVRSIRAKKRTLDHQVVSIHSTILDGPPLTRGGLVLGCQTARGRFHKHARGA